jgi:hypothetical protein
MRFSWIQLVAQRSAGGSAVTATTLALVAVLSTGGCAHVVLAGAPDVHAASTAAGEPEKPDQPVEPVYRVFDEETPVTSRRDIEIPAGFVRMACPGETLARRPAIEFGFQARRLTCRQAWAVAEKVGRETGIDPGILFGVMRVESTLAVNVVSPVGAVGLMQIMPGPADGLGCGDRLDALDNARCGALILSRFLKRYKGDLILGLSAYNAGFGMPNRARKKCMIPANFGYPEKVLRVRARFLRWGCLPWE